MTHPVPIKVFLQQAQTRPHTEHIL